MAIRLLIAEDDEFLSKAYTSKLTKEGFDVKVVGDGEEFLSVIKEFNPDLAIVDIVMPRLDGFATLQRIKMDASLKDIPIIVASNLGQSGDEQKAKELGADDYLVKSELSMKDLVERIEKLARNTSQLSS